jgi:hypothetical protein
MMKRTGLLFGIFLFFPAAFPGALDWPVQDGLVTRNFGWNDEGKPILGVSFRGEGPVLAAGQGDLLFSHSPDDNWASRLPSPLGSWLALDHGDGLISIYSRGEAAPSPVPERVERNTPVALMGRSGWSPERGVYFSLFDRRERRWINPSMIISPLPDTRPPVFHWVLLRTPDGRRINPAGERNLSQGKYTVLAAVSDTSTEPGNPPLAPYRIICSVNGAEASSLSFETLSSRDGRLMVYRNGLVPAKQIYAPFPGFEVGEVGFTRGQATLEIVAQDIAGNSRSVVYRLFID